MRTRPISLTLLASLFAWSTGLLLAVHLHDAKADHDPERCQECLVLIAGPAAVEQPPLVGLELFTEWAAPAELTSAILVRPTHDAFASRAPPAC